MFLLTYRLYFCGRTDRHRAEDRIWRSADFLELQPHHSSTSLDALTKQAGSPWLSANGNRGLHGCWSIALRLCF